MPNKKRSLEDVFKERREKFVQSTKHQAWMMLSLLQASFSNCKTIEGISCTIDVLKVLNDLIGEKFNIFNELLDTKEQLHDETVAHTKLRDECHPQSDDLPIDVGEVEEEPDRFSGEE